MERASLTVSHLQERLNALRPSAQAPQDHVQLAFVDGLLQRTTDKTGNTLQAILTKASAALERYEIRHQESTTPTSTATDTPSPSYVSSPSQLTALLELLEQQAQQTMIEPGTATLDELLTQNEPTLVRPSAPLTEPAPVRKTPVRKTPGRKKKVPATPKGPELKATRKARKNQAMARAQEMVNEMNQLQPENPGPLNPQMLSTRAIMLMRDLSPAYLNRFLTLLDTLFWLEETASRK